MEGDVAVLPASSRRHRPIPASRSLWWTRGARCLLCQQGIDHDAGHRLRQFEAFVVSTTERELSERSSVFDGKRRALLELVVSTDATNEAIKELRIEHDDLAAAVDAATLSLEARRKAITAALARGAPLPGRCASLRDDPGASFGGGSPDGRANQDALR